MTYLDSQLNRKVAVPHVGLLKVGTRHCGWPKDLQAGQRRYRL